MSQPWSSRRPLPPLVEAWLAWLATIRNLSPNSVETYRKDIRAVLGFLVQHFALDDFRLATFEQLHAFFVSIERMRSAHSRVRLLTNLRSLFRFLAAHGHITQNPTLLLGWPRAPRALPKYLTFDEVKWLLEGARGEDAASVRLFAIVHVFYATGIRVEELSGLKLADVDLARGTIFVMGKGRKERFGQLNPPSRVAVARWIVCRNAWLARTGRVESQADTLFINFTNGARLREGTIQEQIRDLGRAVGLKRRVHPHIFRHSFCTELVANGAPLEVASELMGHASINTTMIYTHVAPERSKSVYAAAHPFGGGAPREERAAQ